MLWHKKTKIHRPFQDDFNLVTLYLKDPTQNRTPLTFVFPENWYCQLIGATVWSHSGAFSENNIFINIRRRDHYVWIFPYSFAFPANNDYYLSWGIGLPSSPLPNPNAIATAPLADNCFIEGKDILSFDWAPKAIDDAVKTGSLYLKQWIVF